MNIIPILMLLASGPLGEADDKQLDAYLKKAAANDQAFEQRLTQSASDALGTTYHDGPLGEGEQGKYDSDPLVDFSRVDCVTYVEQSVAAAMSSNYREMFNNLQRIRYNDGVIDYEHRNHFMISDWIANNPYCEEVTNDLGVDTENLTRTISRRDFFELVKAPTIGQDTPDQDITLAVVPPTAARAAQKNLQSPSLVVFVGKVDWLFSLHCGLYLRDEAGEGKLYHASSKAGQVVAVDLADYVKQQGDRYVGFTAYEISEPHFDQK